MRCTLRSLKNYTLFTKYSPIRVTIDAMKKLFLLITILALPFQILSAGAPSVEIREALVHEVKKTPTGFALVISEHIMRQTIYEERG